MLLLIFVVRTELSVILFITACGSSTSAVEGIREELDRKFYNPESIDTRIGGKDAYRVFGGESSREKTTWKTEA
jgi:hypothetical protein